MTPRKLGTVPNKKNLVSGTKKITIFVVDHAKMVLFPDNFSGSLYSFEAELKEARALPFLQEVKRYTVHSRLGAAVCLCPVIPLLALHKNF